jgi:hypothetical protein
MIYIFMKPTYAVLVTSIAVGFFILFNVLDGYLFFSPVLAFHVPADAAANFSLSIGITILLALVITASVYMVENMQLGLRGSTSWLSGSFIATATGACGCTSLGFAIISTFGGAGVVATSFLTNYQLPLKIISFAILAASFYSVRRNLIRSCVGNNK